MYLRYMCMSLCVCAKYTWWRKEIGSKKGERTPSCLSCNPAPPPLCPSPWAQHRLKICLQPFYPEMLLSVQGSPCSSTCLCDTSFSWPFSDALSFLPHMVVSPLQSLLSLRHCLPWGLLISTSRPDLCVRAAPEHTSSWAGSSCRALCSVSCLLLPY